MLRWSLRSRTGNSVNRGTQSSSLFGNANPAGITPTMVAGVPLMRSDLPMMSDLPPKSRCQMAYPMIATFSAPGLLSSGLKSRPRLGDMPRMRRKASVTYAPV